MADLTKELLAAAAKLPMWQQDALRRLTAAKLSESDFAELVALAKAEYLGSSTGAPLTAGHLSMTHSGVGKFAMLAIHSVQGVNALEPGQRIDFSPTGLTVVFGENGAGKSGYSRVMRRACRARKAPAILPNVSKAGPVLPPRATFVVSGDSGTAELVWSEKAAHDPLASFAVFDRECERGIVEEKGAVAFVPPALGLFDELAQAASEVKRRIEAEAGAVPSSDQLEDLAAKVQPFKEAADIVSRARPNRPDADYVAAIKALAAIAWGQAEEDALTAVAKRVLEAGSPLERAKALRGLAGSVAAFRTSCVAAETALGDAPAAELRAAQSKYAALADAAAKEAAGFDFSREPADAIGKDAWQALYVAAAAFAVGNMKGGPEFPSTADGAACPLCLTELDGAAKARIDRFRSFMAREAKAAAERERKSLDDMVAKLAAVRVPTLDPHVAEQSAASAGVAQDAVAGISKALSDRKELMTEAAKSGAWIAVDAFSPVTGILAQVEAALMKAAGEAEKLATPAALDAAKAEAALLTARKTVHEQRVRIETALKHHRKAAALRRLAATVGTREISLAGKGLAVSAITGTLRQSFSDELSALGASRIRAEISESASKGKATYGVTLPGHAAGHSPGQVLSEGEQRVVALAYFLAETAMAPEKVGIIIDDPVSSLDHRWAERIAARLAQIGLERQVIVFTHSIAFLTEIERTATEASVACKQVFIERTATGAGRCGPDAAPWEKLSVGTRVQRFRAELTSLRTEHAKSPDGRDYARRAAQLCGDIRSAWERAVEEVVLNGVVERFGYAVSTGKLKGVACTDATYKAIYDAMTRLSAITAAHDKAAGAFPACPDPDEIERFVKSLEDFVKAQKAEAKKAEDARKQLEGPPTSRPAPPPVPAARAV